MSKGSDKEKTTKRRDSKERQKGERRKKSERNSESRDYRDENSKRRRYNDSEDVSDYPPKRYWNKDEVTDAETDAIKRNDYKVGSRYYDGSSKNRDEKRSKKYEVGTRYYEVEDREKNKNDNVVERKPKKDDTLATKTGGAYIPPAKLKMMRAEITDKSSMAYQRLSWEALKKSIHGFINKINTGNIATIIKELLRENIVRGRGLLCRSIIQAQAASPTFTHVYAALSSAINSRFPNIGELLLKRLVVQFKRGFKRNDKATCISGATFIAHLVNQKVSHEILALEILTLLVESPTDDSVEVAIAFLKECGQKLTEVSAKGVNAIFEMLRNILHEGQLDKRVQYMIEVMFQIRKDGFKDHVAVVEELELVPEDDQFTHLIMLDEVTDPQDLLNVFKFDPDYEGNEGKYKELSKEILGSDAESNSDEESESGDESGSETEEENQENAHKDTVIIDNTETNLIALRRTIYLTIHSSLDFEECAHKLMKMQLKPGQEMELCHMFLDCCAEQRTYEKFYGLLAQRFCQISKIYVTPFEQIFKDSYGTAHRLDTNRLRNVSKFFAHLLFTDAISWEALECVKLNEEDTTSSSRIFVKILFQELAEYMGLGKLNERLKDVTLQDAFTGIFPRDNPKNTRFAINFFTSIGLGGLTDELREHLKQAPKPEATNPVTELKDNGSSSSSSSSDSSDSSSSSSSSESSDSDSSDSSESEDTKKKKKDEKNKNSNRQSRDIEKSPKRPPFKNNKNRVSNQASKSNNYNDKYQSRQPDKRANHDDDNQSKYFDRRNERDRRNDEEKGDKVRRNERVDDQDKRTYHEKRNNKERFDDQERRNDRTKRNDKEKVDDQEKRNEREKRSDKERIDEPERRNDRIKRNDKERIDDLEKRNDRYKKNEIDDQENRNNRIKRNDKQRVDPEKRNDREKRNDKERIDDQERRNDHIKRNDKERFDDQDKINVKERIDDQERRNNREKIRGQDRRGEREKRGDCKDHSGKRRY